MDQALPDRARKGRGAVSNRSSRFDAETRIAVDDGWTEITDDDLPPLRTTVARDATRTIIARNDSPDIGFDRSINPYRGCEHAASTASRGRPTLISACRPGSISRPS